MPRGSVDAPLDFSRDTLPLRVPLKFSLLTSITYFESDVNLPHRLLSTSYTCP